MSQAFPHDLAPALPDGYRARAFEDADREAIVTDGNAESHPMEAQTAAEWREWESISKDPTLGRVVVVAPGGEVAALATIQTGMAPRPDGSQQVQVRVVREHRRRGIGGALLDALEAEAHRRGVPRLLSSASASRPSTLDWAGRRGYREIGRRIMSYRELASYDPSGWRASLERVASAGIRLRSFGEVLSDLDDAGRDRFWRALWEAEGPMWDDIPFATPMPHWSFERFHELTVRSRLIPDASVVAYDGDRIVGFTTTGARGATTGWTYMTGVARTHRGRGVAMALKVSALERARAKGLRAMCTVNDEPNKAMRSVNIRLGYQPVPDSVELEKTLS